MKHRSPFRSRVEYALFAGVRAVAGLLTPRGAESFGALLGRVTAKVAGKRTELAAANLRAAFPDWTEERIRSTAIACWEHFGRVAIDYLRFGRLSREGLLDRIDVTGREHFRKAREAGRGVFLLSAHLGHWEIGALAAGLLEEPIAIVVRPLDNPLLEDQLRRHRERHGNRVVAKDVAAREMLRQVRGGGTVAILVDQKVRIDEAVVVPFFARPARTTPALARLAVRTGAAIVPVWCRPIAGEPERFELVFEAPIFPTELSEEEKETERLTARFMELTERAVRVRPELWLWMHDRWRVS